MLAMGVLLLYSRSSDKELSEIRHKLSYLKLVYYFISELKITKINKIIIIIKIYKVLMCLL